MNEHPAIQMTDAEGVVITNVDQIPSPAEILRVTLGALPRPDRRVFSEDIEDPARRNQYRASLAGPTLQEYAGRVGGSDIGTTVQDLLSDLMHLCDATEINFDAALGMARNRYDEEIAGE